MIKTILVDDEHAALKSLSRKIEIYCSDIELLATSSSSKEGLQLILDHKPDLVFLDIEMPWMNGFELLDSLEDKLNFNVVFVTAYNQYAIQAFKQNAIDYLLKPVDKDDLIKCIERVKLQINKMNQVTLKDLIAEIEKPTKTERIMIHTSEGVEVLESSEITFCHAASNYTYIHTLDGRKIVASKTLSEIEKSLNPKIFLRVHKSYNTNLKLVQKYSNTEGGKLILKNKISIPVSRRKKDNVLMAIANLP